MYVTNKPATAIIIALAAFLIATLALACSSATPRAGDVNTDRAALAALYNATNGSSWLVDTNWLSKGPLGEWHGVSTDADGRVAELDLDGKQLSGPIPSELGNLTNLERLSLWGNQLSGPIPSELGNLANLEFLSLRDNQLSGPIPSELGNLANLEWLILSRYRRNLDNLADTVGTGQPRQPASAGAPRQPVERADTVGTGQPRQLGIPVAPRNQLSGSNRRNWATSTTCEH